MKRVANPTAATLSAHFDGREQYASLDVCTSYYSCNTETDLIWPYDDHHSKVMRTLFASSSKAHRVRCIATRNLKYAFHGFHHIFNGKAEVFEQFTCRSRFAKGIHANYRTVQTNIFVPKTCHASFDSYAFTALW